MSFAYLVHIWDASVETHKLEPIPMASEFSKVFPKYLPGLKIDHSINLCIDVEPRSHLFQFLIIVWCRLNWKSWGSSWRVCSAGVLWGWVYLLAVLSFYLWKRTMYPWICVSTIDSWTSLPLEISTQYLTLMIYLINCSASVFPKIDLRSCDHWINFMEDI